MYRVTHIAPCLVNPPGEMNGGVAGYIIGLARAQAQIGLQVRIVFPNVELGERFSSATSWNVEGVEAQCVGGRALGQEWRCMIDASISKSDILHIHTPYAIRTEYAMYRAWMRRVPFITHTHGKLNPAFRKRRALAKMIWEALLWRLTVKRSSFVLLSGEDEHKLVSREFRYATLPNGFDPIEFNWPLDFDSPLVDRYLLFLGYLDPRKRIDLALRAFARCAYENSRFIIAGPDRYGIRSDLQSLARDLGISENVEFVGPVFGSKKVELLSHARALVLLSEGEGMANVMLEAIGTCTPMIFSKGCVFSDVDKRGGGIQVGDDLDEIGKVFSLVLSDEMLHASMRSALRDMQAQYAWSTIARQSVDLYSRSLASF